MESGNNKSNGGHLEKLQSRIEKVENLIKEIPVAGMLSSRDFQDLCVSGDNGNEFLNVFEEAAKGGNNDWSDERLFQKDDNGNVVKPLKALFYINPFNKLNITPFSYDLAIGNQVYSLKGEKRRKRLISIDGYPIEPRETVIVLTRESIAIPPHYAATVWPRFGPVSEGIFQSMVKIDPTWRGRLAVALTNVSPSTYPIKENQLFATLILYRLTSATSFSLCDSKDIEDIPIEVTDPWFSDEKVYEIERKLKDSNLYDLFYFRKNANGNYELVVKKGFRKERIFNRLLQLYPDLIWHKTIESLITNIINEGKIGKSAYKMDDLDTIISGVPDGKRLTRADLKIIIDDDIQPKLEQAAIQYGGPCRWLPNLKDIIMSNVEQDLKSKIQSDVESNLFPKIVTLTLTVIAMLSLVTAIILVFINKVKDDTTNTSDMTNWPDIIYNICIILSITTVIILFIFFIKNIAIKSILYLKRSVKESKEHLFRNDVRMGNIERSIDDVRSRQDKIDEFLKQAD